VLEGCLLWFRAAWQQFRLSYGAGTSLADTILGFCRHMKEHCLFRSHSFYPTSDHGFNGYAFAFSTSYSGWLSDPVDILVSRYSLAVIRNTRASCTKIGHVEELECAPMGTKMPLWVKQYGQTYKTRGPLFVTETPFITLLLLNLCSGTMADAGVTRRESTMYCKGRTMKSLEVTVWFWSYL
jgi:hypothetical protein